MAGRHVDQRTETGRASFGDVIRPLMEALDERIILIDSHGCIVGANKPFETAYRWPRDDLVGSDIREALGDIDLQVTGAAEVRRGDGSIVRADMQVATMDGDDPPPYRAVIFHDPENEIGAWARDTRFLDASPMPALVFDRDAKSWPIVYVNAAMEELAGAARRKLVGRSVATLFSPETRERCIAQIPASGVVRIDRLNCTVAHARKEWAGASLSITSMEQWGVSTSLVLASLATADLCNVSGSASHEDLEQRVQDRTEELARTNADLEGFTYSVSHDLRAPLRAIIGFSKLLMEDHGEVLGEDVRSHLQRISGAADRMARIIDDLLTFSRLGRKEVIRQPVDLTWLAESTIAELLRNNPESQAKYEVDRSMIVEGDPTLLRLAVENLIENAFKFTSKERAPMIEVLQLGERLFCVRDNGVGFDPAYADKLFRPFERLHSERDFPGTGIGLANVRRIIERHGGRVWAEGSPNHGASFYFTLS